METVENFREKINKYKCIEMKKKKILKVKKYIATFYILKGGLLTQGWLYLGVRSI